MFLLVKRVGRFGLDCDADGQESEDRGIRAQIFLVAKSYLLPLTHSIIIRGEKYFAI